MGGKAGKMGVKSTREKHMNQEGNKVSRLKSMLEREDGWDFASGIRTAEAECDEALKKRAITRITKKAVQMMYPKHQCFVHKGRGKARGWVEVNLIMPEHYRSVVTDANRLAYKQIIEDVTETLVSLGISYKTLSSGSTPQDGEPTPCVQVTVNGIG